MHPRSLLGLGNECLESVVSSNHFSEFGRPIPFLFHERKKPASLPGKKQLEKDGDGRPAADQATGERAERIQHPPASVVACRGAHAEEHEASQLERYRAGGSHGGPRPQERPDDLGDVRKFGNVWGNLRHLTLPSWISRLSSVFGRPIVHGTS